MLIHSFINGQDTTTTERSTIKKNPYYDEPQHTFYTVGLFEAVTAIQTAQKFFSEFKQTTGPQRIELLQKIESYIQANKIKFAKLEAQDQGLPLDFVLRYSIEAALVSISEALMDLSTVSEFKKYSAVGVITIITSWNLSLRLVAERLFPAIAAGNTVVLKISSMSPVTTVILKEILQAVQAPAGLVQIVLSNDIEVKKLLVTHPGVKAVSFVGLLPNAIEVIKWISSISAQQFKKLQIATGAKNSAAVICEPTEEIFKNVMSSFLLGQGQLAWNSSRLFVLEKNEKIWLDKIKDYFSQLRPAESIEDSSPWTPVLKEESYKTFAEINALAIADQARLVQTSFSLIDSQKNNFLPVTFTQDMSNCSTLQQDQVMSPLFIFSTVKYPFDIQKYSNVSYFGLAAHLWGEDEKLEKISDSLEVGRICKNKWSVQVPGPTKSVKQSGFGLQDYRSFGDFFSNVKVVT